MNGVPFMCFIQKKALDIDIDIDIEILFFVEYSQTCNISPVGLLFRQTRVKQHAKISQHAIKNNTYNGQIQNMRYITACKFCT